jgi:flavin reductase (DIM6/NTAB) family NADH-FMN oxidoreductase RutF
MVVDEEESHPNGTLLDELSLTNHNVLTDNVAIGADSFAMGKIFHVDGQNVGVDAFAEIFDRLDRELWLITARAGDQSSGLIATYVSRVSLVPSLPRVTVAIAKHHFTHELIEASNAFCMHLVDENTMDWVWRFGIPSGRDVDKLHGLGTSTGVSGSPILGGAPAWLDCRVEARMDTGDRTVYLAEVLDLRIERPSTPLTFKRLLERAPTERLREMKQALERDMELDRAAILDWRRARAARPSDGTRYPDQR